MRVAFYAPMKPPGHPTPSGDRTMARALISALETGGHNVSVASDLRTWEGAGDPEAQQRLSREADEEIARILRSDDANTWGAWITYHNYYKAPDLIGPRVCAALEIPYILVESTRAKKRLEGRWASFAVAAEAACDAAGAILFLTHRDAEALREHAPAGQRLIHLPPFLPRTELPAESHRDGPILSVGMMRPGDKLASYRLIADTLALLPGRDWRIDIAGDGTARNEVEQMLAPFDEQVRFLGRLAPAPLEERYLKSSVFFWPGVNEAFGLVYLEAQAAGLPVVAQDRPGVRDILAGNHPRPSAGPSPMAERLTKLLADAAARREEGRAGREKIARDHLLGSAARRLDETLEALT